MSCSVASLESSVARLSSVGERKERFARRAIAVCPDPREVSTGARGLRGVRYPGKQRIVVPTLVFPSRECVASRPSYPSGVPSTYPSSGSGTTAKLATLPIISTSTASTTPSTKKVLPCQDSQKDMTGSRMQDIEDSSLPKLMFSSLCPPPGSSLEPGLEQVRLRRATTRFGRC